MQKVILTLFLIVTLVPVSSAFSQVTDTKPTLSVSLTSSSPFVYQDDEGYTVVVGSVENKNQLTSVTNVQIRAVFYDSQSPIPLEIVTGGTILEVIPPNGKSPYMIKSNTPNPQIKQVNVVLENFNSSTSKSKLLTIKSTDIYVDGNLVLTGVLKNGGSPVTDANVYLAFYDAFQPPRILEVVTIPLGKMEPDTESYFEFDREVNPRAVGFTMFSESNVFYSDVVDMKIPKPEILNKFVTIASVSITDLEGKSLSEIKLGSTVKIQSRSLVELLPSHTSSEIPYTYYVQVKESGEKPYVEFVGKYDGRYVREGAQTQSVDWIPEKKGLFFVETFVWDRSNIPIADPGPVVLILVS